MPTGPRLRRLAGRADDIDLVTRHVLRAAAPFRTLTADLAEVSGAPVLLLGDAGVGKSALLADVARRAADEGFRVLWVSGTEQSAAASFGGLGRLLGPVRDQLDELPPGLGGALAEALQWGPGGVGAPDHAPEGAASDPWLVPHAVLTALSRVAEDRPVLVVVDDVHELDSGSRDVVAAVCRRLSDSAEEGLAILFAQRGQVPLPALVGVCDVVDLRPLGASDAGALLDDVDPSVTGRARLEILRLAAGNPLALVELSRAVTQGEALPRAGDPMPVTDAVRQVFARDLTRLPAETRRALLLVACGEHRLSVLESPAAGVRPESWEPAELADLVTTLGGQARFRHPLIQALVHDAASATERRVAHDVLAGALADEPGPQAWHRSAGGSAPDDRTAADLEGFAAELGARGDALAAATMLERAAAITSDTEVRARRLLIAAEHAGGTGSAVWVRELTDQVRLLSHDRDLRAGAAALAGWSAAMDGRHRAALDLVLSAADDIVVDDPGRAEDLLGTAALPAYSTGSDDALGRYRRTWSSIDPAARSATARGALWTLWTAAVAVPDADLAARVDAVPPAPGPLGTPEQFATAAAVGAASYVLDRTEQAVAHLTPVVDTIRRGVVFTPALTTFAALGWALLDAGRLQRAAENAQEASRVNAVARLRLVDAVARVQLAVVAGLRGSDDADRALARADELVAECQDHALEVHLAWLRGRVADATGDVETSWAWMRSLFDADGRPVHRHLSSLAVAEVVAVGRRAGRGDEARALVAPVLARSGWRSARQQWVEARVGALGRDDATAAVDSLAALLDADLSRTWPLERALALLELGELQRRLRRHAEAKAALAEAAATFARLGARPFEDRAHRGLRAAGVSVGPSHRDPLAELTAQQVQIVRMAAAGLTNREIGQALFLSPRTVGSHLYRSFPKLGVASRAHLPGVVAAWDAVDAGAVT
ncbi:AAA family ATPase [Jatrophihabitans sp. YIM 134969]